MERKVISFRVTVEEESALEAHKLPGESINQVALRLLKGVLGMPIDTPVNATVNSVDVDTIKNRLDKIEQQLEDAIATPEKLRELIETLVNERIRHSLDILSDHQRWITQHEEGLAQIQHNNWVLKSQLKNAESLTNTEIESVKREAAIAPTGASAPALVTDTQPEVDSVVLPEATIEGVGAIASPTKKYFSCPKCSNQGYEDADFKREGFTKSGTQKWKCLKCKNIRSESTILIPPPFLKAK